MALQKAITLDTGIELPEAYIRATDVMLSYGQYRGWITVSYFANQTARQEGRNPVKVEEYRVFNENGKTQEEASYIIRLNPFTQPAEGETIEPRVISIDLNGDGSNDVAITEEVDFETTGDFELDTHSIVDALNANLVFAEGFTAEMDNIGSARITAKADGSYKASNGNRVIASGEQVVTLEQIKVGRDSIEADFDKFFNIDQMSMQDINVISQAYEYLKALPQFADSIDVI